jgi:hypothetical protein
MVGDAVEPNLLHGAPDSGANRSQYELLTEAANKRLDMGLEFSIIVSASGATIY